MVFGIDLIKLYVKKKYKHNISVFFYECNEDSEEKKLSEHFENEINRILTQKKNNGIIKSVPKIRIFWSNEQVLNATTGKVKILPNTYYILLRREMLRQARKRVIYKCQINHLNRISFDASSLKLFNTDLNNDYNIQETVLYMMVYSVVLHELGHILFGHVSKLMPENMKKDGYLCQAKEYCADCFIVNEFCNAESPIFGLDNIYAFSTANVLFFSLLKENREDNKELCESKRINGYDGKDNDHPYPLIRMNYLIESLKQQLNSSVFILDHQEKERIYNYFISLLRNEHKWEKELEWQSDNVEEKEKLMIETRIEEVKDFYKDTSLL